MRGIYIACDEEDVRRMEQDDARRGGDECVGRERDHRQVQIAVINGLLDEWRRQLAALGSLREDGVGRLHVRRCLMK